MLQHRRDVVLHGGELALGDADLVAADGRQDHARRIFRVAAERDHVVGDAMHRPHEHVVQREIEECARDHRDDQRYPDHVARIAPHRPPQRTLVDDDLEEVAAHRGRADHPHDVGVAAQQQGVERAEDRPDHRHVADVDVLADLFFDVDGGEHPALLVDPHRQHAGADAVEQALGEAARYHVLGWLLVGGPLEHQRRRVGGRQPVGQVGDPEVRDRRDVEHDHRHHGRDGGQREQLARQAEAGRPAPIPAGCRLALVLRRNISLNSLFAHQFSARCPVARTAAHGTDAVSPHDAANR